MRRPSFTSTCRLLLTALVAASLAAVGCTASADQPPCADETDNDDDGLVDDADPSCAAGNGDESDDPVRDCNDGEDNDDDGLIDFPADPGCENGQDNHELNSPVPECDDGVDNDDDGHADYPDDPGCFSALQASEADDCPDGPNCPQCGNGTDDDDDDVIDYPADSGCTAASDNQERAQDLTACQGSTHEPLPPGLVTGSLIAGSPATLTSATCGGSGVEKVYEVYIDEPLVMVASTDLLSTSIDTVLYLRARCAEAATELSCNDDVVVGSNLQSTITVALEPGYYYLIVDGKTAAAVGNFQLQVDYYPGAGADCDPENAMACAPGLVCRTVDSNPGPTCEQPVCNDGRDEDGDTLDDYPDDPGCSSPADATEDDDCATDGPTCPACGNGSDDDGDQLVDFPLDTDCSSASQVVEGCGAEQDPIVAISDDTYSGTNVGAHDDFNPTCGSDGGKEIAHFLTLPVPVTSLVIDTEDSSFDTLVYVDDASCDTTLLGCDDDSGSDSGASRLALSNLAAGTYAVFVDGYTSSTTTGAYRLNIHGIAAPNSACTDTLFTAGMLTCPSTHPCDGAICAPPDCGNTVDDDGDGFVGFPTDPGCTGPLDPDETDTCPAGGSCPVCSNDLDDDGDGLFDYPEDPNCQAANGASEACADPDPIDAISMPLSTGSTAGLTNNFSGSCSASTGPDKVFTLSLPIPVVSLRIDTIGSSFDTVVMVKTAACESTDLACDNNTGGSSTSLLTLSNVAAGSYAVVVDGSGGASGNYLLNVRGEVAPGASCTSPLFGTGVLACAAGQVCNGTTCAPTACNDAVDADGDGKNGYPGDPGCTSVTDNDEADTCFPTAGPTCPRCGNGVDDEGDGLIDFGGDPSCPAASVDDESGCASANDAFLPITGPVMTGNLDTEGNDLEPSCLVPSGRDVAYKLEVPFPLTTLYVDTQGSTVNTAVAVRANGCSGADLACNDSSGDDGVDAYLIMNNVAAGRYGVILDSANNTTGLYQLNVRGVIAEGGACDPDLAAAGLFECVAYATCTGPAGAATCVPMACANGVDDGDTDDALADALDPGCLSLADDDETNPTAVLQCHNGSDDDSDGPVDYPADSGCRRAADPLEQLCVDASGVTELTTARVSATTAGAGADATAGCQASSSGAPDRVYSVTVPGTLSTVTFNANLLVPGGNFDKVVYVRRGGCTTDVVCSDGGSVTLPNATPGTYFVYVDGNNTNAGAFILGVNGVIAAGQACDPLQIQAGMFSCAPGTACVHNVCE